MMDVKRLTGIHAGSLKYDLLTALSILGLHGTTRQQIAMNRLITTITARYNWRQDEFSVGQRDLARMWNITERTVKREIKYWIDSGLVICKRQGVRGRVAAYRLNYPQIFTLSESYWSSVGPDFVERMSVNNPIKNAEIVQIDFTAKDREPQTTNGSWRNVCRRLRGLHPAVFKSWISQLVFQSEEDHVLTLEAPSKFVAQYVHANLMTDLDEAVSAVFGPGRRIKILVKD